MEKENLNPRTIKIKAQILTPIHIDNGEVYDRLDYFLLGEDWEEIQIVNRKWLNFCYKKDKNLFQDIISSIENGDFIKLEELKLDFYEKYIEEFFEEYGIIDEIKIGEKAKNHLLQEKNYSKTSKNGNNGEIKKFSRFGINKEIFIPGSTLKGIFRTMFLFEELKNIGENDYKKQAEILEKFDKKEEFKKEIFANLLFEDVKVENFELKIEQVIGENSSNSNSGIPQTLENIVSGEFEIIIKDLKGDLNREKLKSMIKKYSNILIKREENILNNLDYDEDLIEKLKAKLNSGIFPIKLGMYKKSSAYKIFWEEMLNDVYNKLRWLLIEYQEELEPGKLFFFKKQTDFYDFKKFYKENSLDLFGFSRSKIPNDRKSIEGFQDFILKNLFEFNKKTKGYKNKKPAQVIGQKLGIGNKSMIFSENYEPLGWIGLSNIEILEN